MKADKASGATPRVTTAIPDDLVFFWRVLISANSRAHLGEFACSSRRILVLISAKCFAHQVMGLLRGLCVTLRVRGGSIASHAPVC